MTNKDESQDKTDLREISEVSDAVLISNDPVVFDTRIQVHENGRRYKTTFTRKFRERKIWEKPDANELRSILPGSIASVLVKPGDTVKKGTKLMIYEAMKMKNIIAAPFDAVIESVEVKTGDTLPKDALLVRLKPQEASGRKRRGK